MIKSSLLGSTVTLKNVFALLHKPVKVIVTHESSVSGKNKVPMAELKKKPLTAPNGTK